jgi:hypothetical protein
MEMSRVNQTADLAGGVVITHKPLSDSSKPIVLNADGVQAQFKLAQKDAGTPSPGSPGEDQLERVTARGNVVVTSNQGNQELTADEALYDAVTGTVEASAKTEGAAVTFLDKVKGVPTLAKRLRWNLRTDEINILEPVPVISPVK